MRYGGNVKLRRSAATYFRDMEFVRPHAAAKVVHFVYSRRTRMSVTRLHDTSTYWMCCRPAIGERSETEVRSNPRRSKSFRFANGATSTIGLAPSFRVRAPDRLARGRKSEMALWFLSHGSARLVIPASGARSEIPVECMYSSTSSGKADRTDMSLAVQFERLDSQWCLPSRGGRSRCRSSCSGTRRSCICYGRTHASLSCTHDRRAARTPRAGNKLRRQ